MSFLSVISLLVIYKRAEENATLIFPEGFKIGVGTSAYQVEGAWNVSDKGLSVWDYRIHENPASIIDGSNGDVACDSYHRYKEDVAILRDLGVDFYRLSISWSRVLPTGFANKVSTDGLQYYKNLLDDLNAQGIEPVVTISHFDHPFVLEEMGGWTNELMVNWFADYARVLFRELGDRVKMWTTINEPAIGCYLGYGIGQFAPGKNSSHGVYICMHNMLKAHAKAYKIYDTEFRKTQGGQIGITVICESCYSKYENDTESGNILHEFTCGWQAHPIFSEKGDYPPVMKQRIAEISKLEGYSKSRLPEFTQTEIDEIRGSSDYFGLNHYSSIFTEPDPKSSHSLWYDDTGVIITRKSGLISKGSMIPQGFGDILRKIKTLYNNPPVYVMENGVAEEDLEDGDHQRIQNLHDYLRELLIAVNRDGCNIKGYAVWSFMDNFEWAHGYTMHYGLVSVDFNNPNRPRTPKLSYKWFQELIRRRKIPPVDFVNSGM